MNKKKRRLLTIRVPSLESDSEFGEPGYKYIVCLNRKKQNKVASVSFKLSAISLPDLQLRIISGVYDKELDLRDGEIVDVRIEGRMICRLLHEEKKKEES